MTRPTIVALAFLLCTTLARADEPVLCAPVALVEAATPPALRLRLPELAASEAQQARTVRNAGIAVTVVGSVFTVLGASLFMKNFCIDGCSHSTDGGLEAGIAMLAVGQLTVMTGVPILASGSARLRRAERTQLSLSATAATLSF